MFITHGYPDFLPSITLNKIQPRHSQRIEILENKILAEEKYSLQTNETIDRISTKIQTATIDLTKTLPIEQKKIDDAYARIEVLDKDVEAFDQTIKDGAAQTE